MKRSRTRVALVAIVALLALLALLPATAAATTHRLGTGTASFSLDPTETGSFLHAGIPPYPIFPARISWGTTHVTFRMPVTGGTWTTGAGAHGTFLLGGGLAYVDPDTVTFTILNLKGWRAGVNTSAGISVSANGTRTPNFFDENLMGSIPSVVTIHGHKSRRSRASCCSSTRHRSARSTGSSARPRHRATPSARSRSSRD